MMKKYKTNIIKHFNSVEIDGNRRQLKEFNRQMKTNNIQSPTRYNKTRILAEMLNQINEPIKKITNKDINKYLISYRDPLLNQREGMQRLKGWYSSISVGIATGKEGLAHFISDLSNSYKYP